MTRKKKSAGAAGGPKGQSQRQLRVGEELRHALSGILSRDALSDPDLAHHQVTVTAVDVSPDLRNAIAYVVPFGVAINDEIDTEALIAALNRATGFFRGQLARDVKLRVSPFLRFRLDESFQQANRIEALLHDPAVARDLAAEPVKVENEAAEDGDDNGRVDGGQVDDGQA